jgi:hypothetical protein
VKFLPDEILVELQILVEDIYENVTAKDVTSADFLDIPSKIQTTDELFEDISDINGIAIPSIWEKWHWKHSTVEKCIIDYNEKQQEKLETSDYSSEQT